MSAQIGDETVLADVGARWRKSRARLKLRLVYRRAALVFSSSLTRRIVALNLSGLFVLAIGFFLFNQFRADIIEAREQSLRTQAAIIAAAVAASVSVDSGSLTLDDPEQLLKAGPVPPPPPEDDAIEFSINPERIGPMLHRLVTPTKTRARIYDQDGALLLDSGALTLRTPPTPAPTPEPTGLERIFADLHNWLWPPKRPAADEAWNVNGKTIPEVAAALEGRTSSVIGVNRFGETVVSVAAPVQRGATVRGVVQLFTQGGDIDAIIASERWGLVRFFLVLTAVMLLLSLSLANTIAEPVRRLAEAAERVKHGIRSRQQIPDFTRRPDEIGHLSGALREMTRALYNRIDAIESFAADVAHELKNPLTSLRSAMETLPRVANPTARDRLLAVMQHDVRRLDRLISDISDASRLDAELVRNEAEPVDLAALLKAVISMAQDSPRGRGVRLTLKVAAPPDGARDAFLVAGHDSRLAQVVNNLIDNAVSFSDAGGEVKISLTRRLTGGEDGRPKAFIDMIIDDDGPGIPPHALEKIFERFYTDRPQQGFGQNSGLGLSISRQIVEAHDGVIKAANRQPRVQALEGASDGQAVRRYGAGARFVVSLPALRS